MNKVLIALLFLLLLPASSFAGQFAETSAAESPLVPAAKPFSTQEAFVQNAEYIDIVDYRKSVAKLKRLDDRKKNSTRVRTVKSKTTQLYNATIREIEGRKALAALDIEAAAKNRQKSLYAAADSEYSVGYEKAITALGKKRKAVSGFVRKEIKKVTRLFTQKRKVRRGKRFKIISFVPKSDRVLIRLKKKQLKIEAGKQLKEFQKDFTSEVTLLNNAFDINISSADTLVSEEKTASYDALNARVESEVGLADAELAKLQTAIDRLSNYPSKKIGKKKVGKAKSKKTRPAAKKKMKSEARKRAIKRAKAKAARKAKRR